MEWNNRLEIWHRVESKIVRSILDHLDDKKWKIAGKLFFGQIGTSCVLNYQFEIFWRMSIILLFKLELEEAEGS